jgi:GDP-L-fucose synthase
MISRIAGYTGEIAHDLGKPDGTPRKLMDVTKLNRLGWKASIPLEEGLRRTYKEYSHVFSLQ